jgi:hypothetical protein
MTARQDFTIDAGRDYQLFVALYENDNTTPLNLLDTTLEWIVSKQGILVLVNKNSTDPEEIDITSIGEGLATIYVHAIDTEDIGATTLEHELIVTDAGGAESTVLRGLVTISKRSVN